MRKSHLPKTHSLNETLVVMQPTFLPWAGYFNLMAQASCFVFLDDVQLEKQSWQTRNRLLMNGQPHWVSIPVRHGHLSQLINETDVVADKRWREKLGRGFSQAYGKHPHYKVAQEIIELLACETSKNLADLNELLIRFMANKLGITTPMHRASELGISGDRSDRLVAICRHLGAKEYLSPLGAADYLAEDGFAAHSPAVLRFQNYQPRPYPQMGTWEFISHLSMVDVIANMGCAEAKDYVLKGTDL